MNLITVKTFTAEATIGLKRGYKNELISQEELHLKLASAQKKVFKELDVKLSARVSLCNIIFSGQDEPSVQLSFIQYPKFSYSETVLKNGVTRLVEILMKAMDQNRVVIVFNDETVMIEEDGNLIDPGVNFSE